MSPRDKVVSRRGGGPIFWQFYYVNLARLNILGDPIPISS